MTDLERAYLQGLEAAAQGCMGTHNPYLFRGTEEQRLEWLRGWKLVRDAMDRELERGRQIASEFPPGHFDLFAKVKHDPRG